MGLYNLAMQGIVSRFSGRQGNGSTLAPRLTGSQSLAIAGVESDYEELARAGLIYVASCGVIGNALGALQTVADVPTTASGTYIYNKSTTGDLCIVLLAVSAHQASGTPAVNAGVLLSTPGAVGTAPTANATGGVVASTSGSGRASNIWINTGATFSTAPAWIDVAGNNQSATAGVGGSLFCRLDGSFLIRPGQAIGVNILSAVGTNHKWGINFLFCERQVDFEG